MPDVVPAVKAAVVNEYNELLVLKSPPSETQPYERWDVPGGAIEYGDGPVEALEREVAEEVGIEVEVGQLAHVWGYGGDGAEHRIGIMYLCAPRSEAVELSDEHTGHRWAPPNEIDRMEMYDELRSTVKDVLEGYDDL